jgi:hypothetical protein
MTTSGLRREAAKGRLVIEQTAGKDYTTLGVMRRMMADAAHKFRPDLVKCFENALLRYVGECRQEGKSNKALPLGQGTST